MKNQTKNPAQLTLFPEKNKVRFKCNQIQTLFVYLKSNTATASMASLATGIAQKNICRYKRFLEKKGYLYAIVKATCKVTGRTAWYLTTNSEMAIINSPINTFNSHV